MHISRLLVIMAAIVPISVEFQIHQVVPVFQTSIVIKAQAKKRFRLISLSATISNGIHAINISAVSGDTGQAAKSSNPDNTASNRVYDLFKVIPFSGLSSVIVCEAVCVCHSNRRVNRKFLLFYPMRLSQALKKPVNYDRLQIYRKIISLYNSALL